MARKSTKSKKTNSDIKIIRNYDPFSMEKRVYDMDNSPRRSYDIYSLEERIYQLEKNGGGGGGSEIVLLQGPVSDISTLGYTVTASSQSGSYAPDYAFGTFATFNNMWIANSASSWLDIASDEAFSLKALKWMSADPNRYSAPVKVAYSDNGTDYTDATIMESSNSMVFVGDNVKAKHWRLYFNTTDSPIYYAGMNDAKMYGYK